MTERIKELEKMQETGEISTSEMEREIRNLIFFPHVYGMTQEQAVKVLESAGYEYLTY